MRYFMLDKVTDYNPGESAKGVKSVTLTDDVLHDHFPDFPIFPGALLIECMAQLSGFLIEMSLNRPDNMRRALLVKVDTAKFHKPAEPGDRIDLSAEMAECLDDAVKIRASAHIEGQKAATAKLTFYLKQIDSERIHEQRRRLYRIWTRNTRWQQEIL